MDQYWEGIYTGRVSVLRGGFVLRGGSLLGRGSILGEGSVLGGRAVLGGAALQGKWNFSSGKGEVCIWEIFAQGR